MTYTLVVRDAIEDDCNHLAKHIRDADRREILDVSGLDPLTAFLESYKMSMAPVTVESGDTGNPVLMCGVSPIYGGSLKEGAVWMMATNELKDIKFEFLRRSNEVLDRISDPFTVVYNVVDKRNVLHIRWLKWLNFCFLREVPNWGVGKISVYEFVRI